MNSQHTQVFMVLWLMGTLLGFAQTSAPSEKLPELCFAQLDRDIYIVGEQLWYSIYFSRPTSDLKSTVVHVDLIDPKGKIVAYNKHPIEENHSYGDFYLDPSWNSGVYTFRVYTLWNTHFSSDFSFVRDLPIFGKDVDPEMRIEEKGSDSLLSNTPSVTVKQSEELAIRTQRNPGDSIEMYVRFLPNGDSDSARVSISVMRMDERLPGSGEEGVIEKVSRLSSLASNEKPTTEGFPVPNSLSYWGSVNSTGESAPQSISVFLTDSSQFRSSLVEGGNFMFSIPNFYGTQVAQVFSDSEREISLSWGKAQDVFPPEKNSQKLPYSEEVQNAYLRHKKRKQFQQLFDLPNLAQPPTLTASRNTLIPDQQFLAEDYIAFNSLEDFIRETVYIRLKGKRPPFALRLLDRDKNLYFKEAPLFLVNGYITYNQEEVLEIPWRDIERVELFLSSFRLLSQFATLSNFGVMAIYTKSQKTPREILEETPSVSLKGFQIPFEFKLPLDAAQKREKENRIPDLRPVEYWNPSIELSGTQPMQLSYPVSDAKGDFVIRVVGVTAKGTPLYREMTYTVE